MCCSIMDNKFGLIIIGGGAAGFAAAIIDFTKLIL